MYEQQKASTCTQSCFAATGAGSAPGPSGLSLYASVSLTVDLAGNGHSTNGSSDTPQKPKKRLHKPEIWKKLKQRRERSINRLPQVK